MPISRVKIWGTEILRDTDLNAEFDNIVNFLNSGTATLQGKTFLSDVTFDTNIVWKSGTAFGITFDHAATAPRTITFPDITDTVVTRTNTETLTNKTLASPSFTGQIAGPAGTAAAPSYSITGNLGVGLYSPATNELSIALNGLDQLIIRQTDVEIAQRTNLPQRVLIHGIYALDFGGTKTQKASDFYSNSILTPSGADGYRFTATGATVVGLTGVTGGVVRIETGAVVNNQGNYDSIEPGLGFETSALSATHRRFAARCALGAVRTQKLTIIGLTTSTVDLSLFQPAGIGSGVFFRVNSGAVATNIFAVTKVGAAETVTDTGIADSASMNIFEIIATTTEVRFFIDGVLKATHVTNIPTVAIGATMGVRTLDAGSKTLDIDWVKELIPSRVA